MLYEQKNKLSAESKIIRRYKLWLKGQDLVLIFSMMLGLAMLITSMKYKGLPILRSLVDLTNNFDNALWICLMAGYFFMGVLFMIVAGVCCWYKKGLHDSGTCFENFKLGFVLLKGGIWLKYLYIVIPMGLVVSAFILTGLEDLWPRIYDAFLISLGYFGAATIFEWEDKQDKKYKKANFNNSRSAS